MLDPRFLSAQAVFDVEAAPAPPKPALRQDAGGPHQAEHPLMAPLRAIGMLRPAAGHTAAAAAAALLSPLQLVRAFSNAFTLTCSQLLAVLAELPPLAEGAAGAGPTPAAVAALGGPAARQWAALQAHQRHRRERERTSAVQMLFAHTSDLLHFSCVMQACPSPRPHRRQPAPPLQAPTHWPPEEVQHATQLCRTETQNPCGPRRGCAQSPALAAGRAGPATVHQVVHALSVAVCRTSVSRWRHPMLRSGRGRIA